MSVIATAKGVRMSPRKVSVVASLVRGRSVQDALTILEHTPRFAAKAVYSVIKSAQANAEHNYNMKRDSLKIVEISVNAGPRMKRFMPAARGSANPYQLKSSHIRVVVDGEVRQAQVKTTTTVTKTKKEAK